MRVLLALGVACLSASVLACGGEGSSSAAPSVQPTPSEANPTATPKPGVCPVDQAICGFALDVEAALQRGDAWSFAHADQVAEEPPTGQPAGDAILNLLKQRSWVSGIARVEVALQSIGCLTSSDCVDGFVLTFAGFADLPKEPGSRVGAAVLGFAFRDGEPILRGINGNPVPPDALFSGGEIGDCNLLRMLEVLTCEGRTLTAYPFTRQGPPRPDTSLGPVATPLTIGPDAEFPGDTTMLVALSGYGHGHGGYFDIVRFTLVGSGPIEREVVWRGQVEGTNVTGIVETPDGTLWLSRCVGDQCHLEGGSSEKDVVTEFHRSRDGGATWEKVAEVEGEWWVRSGAASVGAAVEFGNGIRWMLLPTLEEVAAPPGVGDEYVAPLAWATHLGWPVADRPALVGGDGATLVEFPLGGDNPLEIRDLARLRDFAVAAVVGVGVPGASFGETINSYAFLTEVQGTGASVDERLVRLDGQSMILGGWVEEPNVLAVTADYSRETGCFHDGPENGAIPALLDFETATLSFIADPFFCEAGAVTLVSVARGEFLRVNTPDDCLNLRPAPELGATPIACLGDRALVKISGTPQTLDGTEWIPVEVVNGLRGWVAREFLAE